MASELVKACIKTLFRLGGVYSCRGGVSRVYLNGSFTSEQVHAIADAMDAIDAEKASCPVVQPVFDPDDRAADECVGFPAVGIGHDRRELA